MPPYPYKCADGIWRANPFTEIRFPDYDRTLTTEEHQKVTRFIAANGLKRSTRPAFVRRRTSPTKGGE